MKERLAIVGIFYDGYYDLWEDFLELFYLHWPDCPYHLYIVNNELNPLFERNYDVKVLHAGGDAEYSKKVQTAIENINADYYLLLLEDFFIQNKLAANVLEETLGIIERDNIQYLRMSSSDFLVDPKQKKNAIVMIDPKSEYTVTCQPSIWRKEFLKECIGRENYNAWIFEGIYAKSKMAHEEAFLSKCRNDTRNLLTIRHGAVQGKLLPNVYRAFGDQGYRFKTRRSVLDKTKNKSVLA